MAQTNKTMAQSNNKGREEKMPYEGTSLSGSSDSNPNPSQKKGSNYSSLFMLLLAILGVFLVGIIWYLI